MQDERPRDPVRCDQALTSVFALLGKRWTGVIIGSLLERPARFSEMAEAIPGITDTMLSARLGELQGRASSAAKCWRTRRSHRSTSSPSAAPRCGRRSWRSPGGRRTTCRRHPCAP